VSRLEMSGKAASKERGEQAGKQTEAACNARRHRGNVINTACEYLSLIMYQNVLTAVVIRCLCISPFSFFDAPVHTSVKIDHPNGPPATNPVSMFPFALPLRSLIVCD